MGTKKDDKKKSIKQTPSGDNPDEANFIVGSTPPPGAIMFHSDGTITNVPDSPSSRLEWTVQKMTSKIQAEPYDGEWYLERGKALMGLGRYSAAIPDFSKLVSIYPKYGDYYRMRGLCYYHSGEYSQALADLRLYKQLWAHGFDSDAIQILEKLESA